MNKTEREALKEAATKLLLDATSAEQRAHAVFMRIEAYYHRNSKAPSLEVYASHWLWASQHNIPADALAILIQRYPFPHYPKIQMGYSDWGSYGNPGYRL